MPERFSHHWSFGFGSLDSEMKSGFSTYAYSVTLFRSTHTPLRDMWLERGIIHSKCRETSKSCLFWMFVWRKNMRYQCMWLTSGFMMIIMMAQYWPMLYTDTDIKYEHWTSSFSIFIHHDYFGWGLNMAMGNETAPNDKVGSLWVIFHFYVLHRYIPIIIIIDIDWTHPLLFKHLSCFRAQYRSSICDVSDARTCTTKHHMCNHIYTFYISFPYSK